MLPERMTPLTFDLGWNGHSMHAAADLFAQS